MTLETLVTIVYGLWGLYGLLSVFYVVGYTIWAVRCKAWYEKMLGPVPKIAMRATKSTKRLSGFIQTFFYLVVITFGFAIMLNILAVENTYIMYVLILIVAPWLLVGLCRIVVAFKANKLEIPTSDLLPRRMGFTATFRQDGYESGVFKRE